MWAENKRKQIKLPMIALESLTNCNSSFYQTYENVDNSCHNTSHYCISKERLFSTLKRLKKYLRSTLANDRLSSLALIHRDISLSPNDIFNLNVRGGGQCSLGDSFTVVKLRLPRLVLGWVTTRREHWALYVILCPFVGVDLNLWPTSNIAVRLNGR